MTEAHGASAPTQDEVQALVQKAEQGDRTMLPALRAYMDLAPGVWAQRGDLARVMQQMGFQASLNFSRFVGV